MVVAQFLLLILLIPITSFAPGFFLVRRIRRWAPLEKLAASIAASIVIVYLAAGAIYATMASWRLAWVLTGLSVAALAVSWQDARRLFAVPQVMRVTRLFGALFCWNLLMLATVRTYMGGFWGPDWYEHYERARFFLERWPASYQFIDLYLLPARPPLMNLFSAFFLAQGGTQFANYQLTCAFLNLLPFVPLVLVSSLLVPRATRHAGLLAALLAANPMFLHNAQFTWTKGATGFFVAFALWLYIVGWRRQDRLRMSLAFSSLAAGTLVHYSAGPYAVVIALHYLFWVLRSRHARWKELVGLAVPGTLLLATWFGYSFVVYGVRDTLITNTTVTDARGQTIGDSLSKIAANIVDTLVPALIRGYWVDRDDMSLRRLVDNAFYLYQVNLPFALGLAGAVLMLVLIVRSLSRRDGRAPHPERRFWLFFVVASATLGIATHGARDVYGLAHIGLQPLVQLGLTWLAASLPTLSRTMRGVALAGMAIDFVLGIAIHVYMESLLVQWASDYNLELKTRTRVVFLGDWLPALTLPLQWVVWSAFVVLMVRTYQVLDRLPDADGATGPPRG